MGKPSSTRRRLRKARDANGRWTPGHSGNPNGRPPKEPEAPKLLDELIAETLLDKVPVTDPDGKVRKISRYERIIMGLVDSIPTAKPREQIQILEFLDKRGLFHQMKIMADPECPNPYDEKHGDWLDQQLRRDELIHAIRRLIHHNGNSAYLQQLAALEPPEDD